MSHGHCHDEHSHGGGGHDHVHDHSDDITPAIQNLLYDQIDFSAVRTLNEDVLDSGRAVLQKPWASRFDPEPELASDADEQLIMHIPFTAQIRLHSLHIRTSPSGSAPKTLHVHINNDGLDFDNADSSEPTQTLQLSQIGDVQDIPVKRQLFNSTRHLALFFEDNFGDEEVSRITYIAFKGDYIRLNREPVEVLYEAAARPQDHKVKGKVGAGMGSHSLDGGGRHGF